MLTVVQDLGEPNTIGGSLLDEIVRDGARQMLAAALQAEVAAYVDVHRGEVDAQGRRMVVRNGSHAAREVTTAAGAVQVRQPRVNDKRIDEPTGERRRFSSAILPAWSRKSPRVAEVLPLLYLHGLSSSDFGPALEEFLGSDQGVHDHGRVQAEDGEIVGVEHYTSEEEGITVDLYRGFVQNLFLYPRKSDEKLRCKPAAP